MEVVRAEVIGSLLRPAWLKEARTALQDGRLSPARIKWIEDRAIDEAIAQQEAAGVGVITDGELRALVVPWSTHPMPSRAMDRSTNELALSRNGRPKRANPESAQDGHDPKQASPSQYRLPRRSLPICALAPDARSK